MTSLLPARAEAVWAAMASMERSHGGPRALTASDLAGFTGASAATMRRALRDLRSLELVKHVGHTGNGHQGWQLTPGGRLRYGLPNTHVRSS